MGDGVAADEHDGGVAVQLLAGLGQGAGGGLGHDLDQGQGFGGDAQGRAAGRDWLRERLAEAGARVDTVVVYRRRAPTLDGAHRQRARAAATDGTLWLFSSAEAIANLRQCLADTDWRAARALVTHPRIGAAARAAGFGQVVDTHPSLDAVRASIESLA